jgi:uncharacterized membrane protein
MSTLIAIAYPDMDTANQMRSTFAERRVTPDRVLGRIRPFGGHVLRSSLSGEQEARLDAALAGS